MNELDFVNALKTTLITNETKASHRIWVSSLRVDRLSRAVKRTGPWTSSYYYYCQIGMQPFVSEILLMKTGRNLSVVRSAHTSYIGKVGPHLVPIQIGSRLPHATWYSRCCLSVNTRHAACKQTSNYLLNSRRTNVDNNWTNGCHVIDVCLCVSRGMMRNCMIRAFCEPTRTIPRYYRTLHRYNVGRYVCLWCYLWYSDRDWAIDVMF